MYWIADKDLFVTIVFALSLFGFGSTALGVVVSGKHPLTVADAIETTRLVSMVSATQPGAENAQDVLVSPNGKRWAAMLVRGDLKKNGNWITIIGGRLDTFDNPAPVATFGKLFTKSFGSVSNYGRETSLTFLSSMKWLDAGKRVAFRYTDGMTPIQVVAIDVDTHRLSRLTHHPTNVVSFAIGPAGTIIYSAQARHSMAQSRDLLRRGFVVTNVDAFSLLSGDVDGYGFRERFESVETFVLARAGAARKRIEVNAKGSNRFIPLVEPQFSDGGRYVLLDGTPDEIPPSWNSYTEEFMHLAVEESRRHRDGPAAQQIKQLFVVDLQRLTSHPLWSAPVGISARLRAAWSPDGRSILLAPTFLPGDTDLGDEPEGRRGNAAAEVDVTSGRYWPISLPPMTSYRTINLLRWRTDKSIEIVDNNGTFYFKKIDDKWVAEADEGNSKVSPRIISPVRIEVHQDMNSPPALYAVDTTTRKEKLILDLNPKLRTDFSLGRVEHVTWVDSKERTWSGLLYRPVHETSIRRYPLVIQTHGHAPKSVFSLYGWGSGPIVIGLGPMFSVYAAQALANRDIAVLQIEDKDVPGIVMSPLEPEMYMSAYEAAVEHFAAAGLVDPKKVGLVGFSRTGWHVEYALSHSRFPYAAAISSDNFDGSYIWSSLLWSDEFERDLGAAPYGDGLKVWLERSPAFNADKVNTPLRLQSESAGLAQALLKWEMFFRLRQLGKTVELYIIPDVQHGSHNLQNPSQCFAVQQGAVDWFDFWLNNHEDLDPAKAEQYARWHKLREQRDAADKLVVH